MEQDRQSNSGSKSTIVATGVVCSVVGAVLGAVGLYWLQKKENEPLRNSSPEKIYNKNGSCPICLEEMKELKVLPCGHQYHLECAKAHESNKSVHKCPVCRKEYK